MDCGRLDPRELKTLGILADCTVSKYRNVDPVSETVIANYCSAGTVMSPKMPQGLLAQALGVICSEPFHLFTSSFLSTHHDLTLRGTQFMAMSYFSLEVP